MKEKKSHVIPLIIIILLVGLGLTYYIRTTRLNEPLPQTNSTLANKIDNQKEKETAISETIEIKNKNVVGSYPAITGESLVALDARADVQNFVREFQEQADAELPELRSEFPDTYSDQTYGFDVKADYYSSNATRSIVLQKYIFTGGANGSAFYTTFNESNNGGRITLNDLITAEKRDSFVTMVKKRLMNYSVPGIGTVSLFPESIADIEFENLTRFAVDNDDMILYFDEYNSRCTDG